jgi:plastocyanin
MKLTLTLALLLAFATVTCVSYPTPAPADAPQAVEVFIDNFSFSPATLTVKAGTPITWTNRDDIPHIVVAEDKSFKSKVLDTGEKFTFTPTKRGTYPYYCSVHPKMVATLVVQ